ncbi:ArsR/SmtB family transcription factor [Allorhizocola rhizosphaerae]|uniref:ArsR/SmtB family transcription factor n=1 Tax=Allorhizocola rhizosphaerae TaxID=1872709 RepID=UPI001FE63696|nr:metalloregulator ArsR/SmtB family transcription factor [Allorhizocola rhizosphaerae]
MERTRTIKDSAVLAALAHPLRRRLMDVLRVYGPSTVSTLAERTGQAVGNVSHHLKVLGASDLIEEAPELAHNRRERWYRLVSSGLRWSSRDFQGDPASAALADTIQAMNLDQHVSLARNWLAKPEEEKGEWGDVTFVSDKWIRLTPQELGQIGEEIAALLSRWSDRPDDGQEREPVLVFAYGMPGQP